MGTASSWHDPFHATSPRETGEGFGKEEAVGMFFFVVVKTGTLLFLGLMWLQLGELITSCQ